MFRKFKTIQAARTKAETKIFHYKVQGRADTITDKHGRLHVDEIPLKFNSFAKNFHH